MRRALLVLAAVELVSFGLFAGGAGFYHDDWTLLEYASRARGFWGVVMELGRNLTWSRPVEMLGFAFFYGAGGFNPLAYQGLLLGLEILQGWLFFLLLDGLIGRRDAALMAAVFFLIYPNHAVTHVWFSSSPQSIALVAVLGSMVAHQRWIETRRAGWLLLSMSSYLAGALCYESVLFLPLMLGGGRAARKWFDGANLSRSIASCGRELAPYAPALLAAVLWQRWAVPRLFDTPPVKQAGFSAAHAVGVFKAGFACVTYKTAGLFLRTALPAIHDFSFGLIVLGAAFAASVAIALASDEAPSSIDARRAAAIGGGAALGAFIAANLPYALSHDYTPGYIGLMSRTSALAALPGGLMLAVGLSSIRRFRVVWLAALIGAFTCCNWHNLRQWGYSWRLQKNIIRMAARKTSALPGPATILLAGAPRYINSRLNEVVVFDATWDFSSALRIATGRADLAADVVSPRTRFAGPYKNQYVYRYDRDELITLNGPPSPPLLIRDY